MTGWTAATEIISMACTHHTTYAAYIHLALIIIIIIIIIIIWQLVRRRSMSVDITRARYRQKWQRCSQQLNWHWWLYDCLNRWVFRHCLTRHALARSEHCQAGCSKQQGLQWRTHTCQAPDGSTGRTECHVQLTGVKNEGGLKLYSLRQHSHWYM